VSGNSADSLDNDQSIDSDNDDFEEIHDSDNTGNLDTLLDEP
jgi:hypothetical protein